MSIYKQMKLMQGAQSSKPSFIWNIIQKVVHTVIPLFGSLV